MKEKHIIIFRPGLLKAIQVIDGLWGITWIGINHTYASDGTWTVTFCLFPFQLTIGWAHK